MHNGLVPSCRNWLNAIYLSYFCFRAFQVVGLESGLLHSLAPEAIGRAHNGKFSFDAARWANGEIGRGAPMLMGSQDWTNTKAA